MTTSRNELDSGKDAPTDGLWASASVRLVTQVLGPSEFKNVVANLGLPTGHTRLAAAAGGSSWVDRCPLQRQTPVAEQFAWAVAEAEAVAVRLGSRMAECRVEIWLGVGVAGQRGVTLDETLINRVAGIGAALVLDLYSWD